MASAEQTRLLTEIEELCDTSIGDAAALAKAKELLKQMRLTFPHEGKFPGFDELTRREHEVLAQIEAGASNKETAATLGISRRTVEIHRAHIMRKLGAKNTADLMNIVMSAGSTADAVVSGQSNGGSEAQSTT